MILVPGFCDVSVQHQEITQLERELSVFGSEAVVLARRLLLLTSEKCGRSIVGTTSSQQHMGERTAASGVALPRPLLCSPADVEELATLAAAFLEQFLPAHGAELLWEKHQIVCSSAGSEQKENALLELGRLLLERRRPESSVWVIGGDKNVHPKKDPPRPGDEDNPRDHEQPPPPENRCSPTEESIFDKIARDLLSTGKSSSRIAVGAAGTATVAQHSDLPLPSTTGSMRTRALIAALLLAAHGRHPVSLASSPFLKMHLQFAVGVAASEDVSDGDRNEFLGSWGVHVDALLLALFWRRAGILHAAVHPFCETALSDRQLHARVRHLSRALSKWRREKNETTSLTTSGAVPILPTCPELRRQVEQSETTSTALQENGGGGPADSTDAGVQDRYRARTRGCLSGTGMWSLDGEATADMQRCFAVSVASRFLLKPNDLVLDFGSGCGHTLGWLADLFAARGLGIENAKSRDFQTRNSGTR